jgi:hypothetical protein
MGLNLRFLELNLVTKYRLGMKVYTREGEIPACGYHSDRKGDHALCCGTGGERIARHNYLRDTLYHTSVSAALGPTKEERGLLLGVNKKPGDVCIPCWTGGVVHCS